MIKKASKPVISLSNASKELTYANKKLHSAKFFSDRANKVAIKESKSANKETHK